MTFALFGRTITSGAGVASIASRISAAEGFIVWPPSMTRVAPYCSKRRRLPRPGQTATRPVSSVVSAGSVAAALREPLLPLERLRVHVRDLDSFDDTDRGARREGEPGVVRVDMHLERGLVADDQEGVSERFEHTLQSSLVEPLAFDDEHRAVAVRGQLEVNRVEAQSLARDRRIRDRLAGHAEREPARDLHEPRTARVDHSRVAENVQHLGGARNGVLAAGEQRCEELRRREAPVLLPLSLLGHLADDGEHRPLDRALDGPVGGIARTSERTAKPRSAHIVRTGEHVDEAANDLREDHAGVPASAHQRRA